MDLKLVGRIDKVAMETPMKFHGQWMTTAQKRFTVEVMWCFWIKGAIDVLRS